VAGIGFELKRVLRKGGAMRFIGVSLAGAAVVAGPWLLSVLGIFLIQRFASLALVESPALFSAAVVYSYAFSLIIASGLHYVFTRQVSDLIYDGKNRRAGSALASFLILNVALAVLVSAAGVAPMRLGGVVSRPRLFMAAAVTLFTATCVNWVLMSFISLLKSYTGILLAYLGGCLASFLLTLALGRPLGAAGALLGYAGGQWLAALVLYAMTLSRYRPLRVSFTGFLSYASRYRALGLAGLLYAWSTWVDKVVFWFTIGQRVPGGWFRVFDAYDVPIFFAILTLIPGLIYFTIETETAFYPRLRELLRSVAVDSFQRIQERKYAMIRGLRESLGGQMLLQGIVSGLLVLVAPRVGVALFGPGINVSALRVTLAAVFFHSLFLSLMIFLFYLELYGRAAAAAAVFFVMNLAASLGIAALGDQRLLGMSYLLGGVAGCVAAGAFLARGLRRFDHVLFSRAAAGAPIPRRRRQGP
jgi:polysaccharide biosynthesis protein PelG